MWCFTALNLFFPARNVADPRKSEFQPQEKKDCWNGRTRASTFCVEEERKRRPAGLRQMHQLGESGTHTHMRHVKKRERGFEALLTSFSPQRYAQFELAKSDDGLREWTIKLT